METLKYCKRGHARTSDNVDTKGGCKKCKMELTKISRRNKGVRPYFTGVCVHGHLKTGENVDKHGNCKECERSRKRVIEKRERVDLNNHYISTLMRMSITDIPVEVIEFKRTQILLKREIKNATSNNK